ncbi:MAG: hypothetical protein P4M11_13550 [Candidatus Pacebacteria bacterium]|nr:hypothetical protein [Candidatus Paceibacterota bacterium]
MIKHDLQQIQKNYFEAGVENAKMGNDLILNFKNQIFSAINLYLIFTATLFFFLATKLDTKVIWVPIRVWIGIGVISGSVSLVTGLIALKAEHSHIVAGRRKFLRKAQVLSAYMNTHKIIEVDEIPEELKGVIDSEDIISTSAKASNILTIIQFILFGLSLMVDIIAVIGAII